MAERFAARTTPGEVRGSGGVRRGPDPLVDACSVEQRSALGTEATGTAFVFPGQGSQYPGMGADLAVSPAFLSRMVSAAESMSGRPIGRLINSGDAATIADPEVAQLLVFIASMTLLRELEERHYEPSAVAGHSLGEYSALVACGCLEWEDALSLVAARGRAMALAARESAGSMGAIVGLSHDVVEDLCARSRASNEVAVVANFNAPRQLVVSGTSEAVLRILRAAQQAGALRARALPVGGAFHSRLMAAAEDAVAPLLLKAPLAEPAIPFVSSVTGALVTSKADYRKALAAQITSPVRWVATIDSLSGLGCNTFVEVGPGRVLTGLGRQTLRDGTHLSAREALTTMVEDDLVATGTQRQR